MRRRPKWRTGLPRQALVPANTCWPGARLRPSERVRCEPFTPLAILEDGEHCRLACEIAFADA